MSVWSALKDEGAMHAMTFCDMKKIQSGSIKGDLKMLKSDNSRAAVVVLLHWWWSYFSTTTTLKVSLWW